MKNEHILFIRVVEAATGEKPLNKREKEHVQNCSLCQGRLRAAELTDGALADSQKVLPLIDSDKILQMADKVFEKETSQSSMSPIMKILAVAASFALIIFIAAYAGGFFSSEVETPLQKTAKVKENKVKEEDRKIKPDKLPIGIMKIAAGSVFKGERCELKALADSKVIVESNTYFIVEKGRVEFSVTKGEDFMVKLNDSGLVRVLGTVFTVEVNKKESSVSVSEGLVELIDLGRGISKHLAQGESGIVRSLLVKRIVSKPKNIKKPLLKKVVVKKVAEVKPTIEKVQQKKSPKKFKFSNDPEMIQAEIRDLEISLKFSDTPLKELHQLFKLYTKSSRYGSILNYWRSKGSIIRSKSNPDLKEMHYHACKASIKLNVYNKVCAEFKESYPDGSFPSGMDYHLKMTQ